MEGGDGEFEEERLGALGYDCRVGCVGGVWMGEMGYGSDGQEMGKGGGEGTGERDEDEDEDVILH